MGSSRSGSTLLDILLGSHADVVGTGELRHLVDRGWANSEICACGNLVKECSFWSMVQRRWRNEVGSGADNYAELQRSTERLRQLPRLMRRAGRGHAFAPAYAASTTALVRAIAVSSDTSIVVDSSKQPVRALALSRVEGIDLFVVHLVRDARAVAWSLSKPFAKDPQAGIQRDLPRIAAWRSGLKWQFVNAQCEWVRTQIPRQRSIRVRYEDLVRDPRRTLASIGGLIGVDVSYVAEYVASAGSVEVQHPVAGNRLRMRRIIELTGDEEWRHNMPISDQRVVRALAFTLMRRYGYR